MIHSTLVRPGVSMLVAAGLAWACPVAQSAPLMGPSGSAFYTPPTATYGAPGNLVWYRSTNVDLGDGAPAVKAWNVLYNSKDSLGAANAVTGTVIVPTKAWSGSGTRPIVSYAVGTHGLANSCAPSLQLARGTDYETANISAALAAGYAVVVSDYQGYTNGATPTYLAGASQGQAVLDIVRAAVQIPSVGLSIKTKTAVWGYSQGGQSAAWAGELAPSYAKELNLVGVAAGGIPADFPPTATYLDGSSGSSFLLGGVIGLAQQYPTQIPINTLASTYGKAAMAKAKTQCVFDSLFEFMNHKLSEYTVGNQTLAQFQATPAIKQVLLAQNLGNKKMSAPMYHYHGQADEFIPLDQDIALKKKYCAKLSTVNFVLYPSEHIATQFQAAPYVISWLGDRFAGKLAPSNCIQFAKAPTSTANPGGGDFIVSLRDWQVGGTVDLAGLLSTLTLPAGAKFSADTNLTRSTLTGDLSIPPFQSNLKIANLLPIIVQVSIVPVGKTTGTATLDKEGQLHIRGKLLANIELESLGDKLSIPAGCVTSKPVEFPLDFDGPVSALGGGGLVFEGSTTFPQLTDCGIDGTLSAFFAGAGQKYRFTVKPPAPVRW